MPHILATQRSGQNIVAEMSFNRRGTETYCDKLLQVILSDSLQDGQEPGKILLFSKRGRRKRVHENGAYQAGKTDIWFDEKEPLIHIRVHNTALKKWLAAYAKQHPDVCRQTDADPETGSMGFDIEKDRFSFRLTAPYSEERRRAASEAAKVISSNYTKSVV